MVISGRSRPGAKVGGGAAQASLIDQPPMITNKTSTKYTETMYGLVICTVQSLPCVTLSHLSLSLLITKIYRGYDRSIEMVGIANYLLTATVE